MKCYRWLVVAIALSSHGSFSTAAETLSRAQMEADLKQFFTVTRQAYAYVDEKKQQYDVDLDRMQADALRQLGQVRSNADFHDLLKVVVAGLRDGHCEVYAGHLDVPKPRAWPLLLSSVKEGVVVTGVDPSLAGSGIEIGDVVELVNGRPVEDWISEESRKVSASTDGARQRIAMRRVGATADEAITVTVRHAEGEKATFTVKCGPRLRLPAEPNLAEPPDGMFATGRVLEGGVGYIRIPTFGWDTPERWQAKTDAEVDASAKPARDQIDAAFAAVADTRALVLDLRGNGGGWDNLGAYVLSHLLPGEFTYYSTQTRSSPDLRRIDSAPHLPREDGWAEKWEWVPRKTIFSFYRGRVYAGPLMVLINEEAFSTTDCVATVLADLHPDVQFVGRPTHGGAGGPRVLARLVHSGADVQLNTMRVWGPKGGLIEGHGTRPHVPVEWTRGGVVEGRDADLEAALVRIAEKLDEAAAASGRRVFAGVAAVAILLTMAVIASRKRARVEPDAAADGGAEQ